jgi:hypothetical protein
MTYRSQHRDVPAGELSQYITQAIDIMERALKSYASFTDVVCH